jgi:hypothetical protein
MYAQSENCAGARSPQVAKATIAQIAAILGFMLNLCLHTENYTSTCNLLGGSLPENTAARKPRFGAQSPAPKNSVKNYMSSEQITREAAATTQTRKS